MFGYFKMVAALVALQLAIPAAAADPLTVAATFSVIGDMLAKVGGDHVVIKVIVGADSDCELYQPTAGDVATVASAQAIFLNGSTKSSSLGWNLCLDRPPSQA